MSAQKIAEQLYQTARSAMAQRQPEKARQLLEKAIAEDASHVDCWHLLADTYAADGKIDQAIEKLKAGLKYFPPNHENALALQIHLASNQIRLEDFASAAETLDSDALKACSNWQLLARAGYLFAICEEHKSALDTFQRALEINNRDPELIFNAAAAYRSMGELDIAEGLYNRVVEISKYNYPAYTLRSGLKKQTENSNHIHQLKNLCTDSSVSAEGRIHIYFSLAKELEDLGKYEESFSALKKGADLKKSSLNYNIEPDLAALNAIALTYNSKTLTPGKSKNNNRGQGIIFILGMPRTGSTLVDRILSSLNEVDSAGEPDTFARLFYSAAFQQARNKKINNPTQIDAIKASTDIDFERLGNEYQKRLFLRAKQKNVKVIIDKNPTNYLYIGAIQAALPLAKIVHIKRNPMDACYAIYKTLFKNAHPFSYNLDDLGEYYSAYLKIMDHWRKTAQYKFYELSYESLAQDPEKEAKELIDYCNLEWSDACLNFYNNKSKGTATASAAQIRQPIYKSSIGKWKNFQLQLEPLQKYIKNKA